MTNIIYKHKETGNLYECLSVHVKLKHPESRQWIAAVLYTEKDIPRAFYVREAGEFTQKFEIVPDEDQLQDSAV